MAYPCENNLAGGIECNMTSFYGHPEVSKRELSWHFLQLIKSETKLPWFCFSDFNKINKTSEKKGGGSRSFSQMEAFQSTLSNYYLHELNTFGVRFTWSNKRFDSTYTKEKLDRALATTEALYGLPSSYYEVLPAINSDHLPLDLNFCKEVALQQKKTFIFRYEAAWDLKEECFKIIEDN